MQQETWKEDLKEMVDYVGNLEGDDLKDYIQGLSDQIDAEESEEE